MLRQLLEHYFRIVRASVLDAVPKAIMLMMVNCIQVCPRSAMCLDCLGMCVVLQKVCVCLQRRFD